MGDVTATAGHAGGAARLARVTTGAYWYVVVGVLLCAASLPSVALLLLLDRVAANAPLVPLCLVPYGPALSAALYALRERTRAEAPAPARAFGRGYASGFADVLRLWVPATAGLAVVAAGAVNLAAAGLPGSYAVVLVVVASLVVLWLLDATALATFFSFRSRDVARLAAHYLVAAPRVTVGLVALVVVAAGVVWLTSEAVLWLFAVVGAASWLRVARPLVDDVAARFTTSTDITRPDTDTD